MFTNREGFFFFVILRARYIIFSLRNVRFVSSSDLETSVSVVYAVIFPQLDVFFFSFVDVRTKTITIPITTNTIFVPSTVTPKGGKNHRNFSRCNFFSDYRPLPFTPPPLPVSSVYFVIILDVSEIEAAATWNVRKRRKAKKRRALISSAPEETRT